MTKRDDCDFYTYRIVWSEKEKKYSGYCAEFPEKEAFHPQSFGALNAIAKLVSKEIAERKKKKQPIPQPFSKIEFSGNFTTRITPKLHQMLAMSAAENGMSLNRYITAKLAGIYE